MKLIEFKRLYSLLFFLIFLFSPAAFSQQPSFPSNLKMVNYYPGNAGWDFFWTKWSLKKIDQDFSDIRDLGFNTVRVFVQPRAVGFPSINPSSAEKITQLIGLAKKYNLKIQFTLFDLWGDYRNVKGSIDWLTEMATILGPVRDYVAYVDLQNEVDSRRKEVVDWLHAVFPTARRLLGVPTTFSVTTHGGLRLSEHVLNLKNSGLIPDFWDVHYYSTPERLLDNLEELRKVASPQAVYFGEIGKSSASVKDQGPDSINCKEDEAEQAIFFEKIIPILTSHGFGLPGFWAFEDFSRYAIPPGMKVATRAREYCFGIRFSDGKEKAVAGVVRKFYAGAR